MKILHTTDLHFNKYWFEWLYNEQSNYNVFCITGDLLEPTLSESLEYQIEWISSWMKSFQKPLFVCSGNHDIEDLENENWLDKVQNIYSDNAKKTIDGIKFGSIPYLGADFLDFTDCDILLNHIPPSNTKTAIHKTSKEDWGDKDLFRLINRKLLAPKYILCGHMHHPVKQTDKIHETTILNCGSQKSKKIPNFSKLDIIV